MQICPWNWQIMFWASSLPSSFSSLAWLIEYNISSNVQWHIFFFNILKNESESAESCSADVLFHMNYPIDPSRSMTMQGLFWTSWPWQTESIQLHTSRVVILLYTHINITNMNVTSNHMQNVIQFVGCINCKEKNSHFIPPAVLLCFVEMASTQKLQSHARCFRKRHSIEQQVQWSSHTKR